MQAILHWHPSLWYLVPFRPHEQLPGVWTATWLFLTLTLTRQT